MITKIATVKIRHFLFAAFGHVSVGDVDGVQVYKAREAMGVTLASKIAREIPLEEVS